MATTDPVQPAPEQDYSNSLASQMAAVRQQIEANQKENTDPVGFRDTLAAMGRGLVSGFAKEVPIIGPAVGALVTTDEQKQHQLNNSFGNVLKLIDLNKAQQDLKDEPAIRAAAQAKTQRETLKAQYEIAGLPTDFALKQQELAQRQLQYNADVDKQITEGQKATQDNLSLSIVGAGIPEVDAKDFLNSPKGKAYTDFLTMGRNYLNGQNNPIARDAALKQLSSNGYTLNSENGKNYISGNGLNKVELNHDNFVNVSNTFTQTIAEEVAARKQMIDNQKTMQGTVTNELAKGFMVNNPDDKEDVKKAMDSTQEFIKLNNFTPKDYQVYSLTTLADQLKDGTIPDAQRQDILHKITILGQGMGYKGFPSPDGQIMVSSPDGKTAMSLDLFNEKLKQDDRIRTASAGWFDTMNKNNVVNRDIAAKTADFNARLPGVDLSDASTDPAMQKNFILAESRALDKAGAEFDKSGDNAKAEKVYKDFLIDSGVNAAFVNKLNTFKGLPEKQQAASMSDAIIKAREDVKAAVKSTPKGSPAAKQVVMQQFQNLNDPGILPQPVPGIGTVNSALPYYMKLEKLNTLMDKKNALIKAANEKNPVPPADNGKPKTNFRDVLRSKK